MADPRRHNIGAYAKLATGLVNLANAAGTRNGDAIDRLSYGNAQSCVLISSAGAATGTPDSGTLDVKIQSSADGSTGWTEVTGGAFAQKTTITALDRELDVDLGPAHRYVRIVEVTAFVNGSTPKTPHAVLIVFGGGHTVPMT
jgi:hypothetical protein